jgi:protein required for attachment to host cells
VILRKGKIKESEVSEPVMSVVYGEKHVNFKNEGNESKQHMGRLRSQNIDNSNSSSQAQREKK